MTEITKAQTRTIEDLRKRYAPREGYEFKQNEIRIQPWDETSGEYSLFLILETGLINDEGTAAAIFARDHRMFMIGKRGGIRTHNGKTWVRGDTGDTYL